MLERWTPRVRWLLLNALAVVTSVVLLASPASAEPAHVEGGARIWRVGTTGRSNAADAQFWSLEHPSTPGFADRYGIPPENVLQTDFVESAVVPSGTPFVTRPAPRVGPNTGGGIEVVVPEGSVTMCGFSITGGC